VILVTKGANSGQRATSLPGNLCSVPEHQSTEVRVMGYIGVARTMGIGSLDQGREQGEGALVVAVEWWLCLQQVLSRCWRRLHRTGRRVPLVLFQSNQIGKNQQRGNGSSCR
jgi:hypothetical protein